MTHGSSVARIRRELPAATAAVLAAAALLVLIYVGSRGLKDFDAVLVGYAVGSVFALAAIVYRYTLWITRPPTWRLLEGGLDAFPVVAQLPTLRGADPDPGRRPVGFA